MDRTAAAIATTAARKTRTLIIAISSDPSVDLLDPARLGADPGQVHEVVTIGGLGEQVEVVEVAVLGIDVGARLAPTRSGEPRRDPPVGVGGWSRGEHLLDQRPVVRDVEDVEGVVEQDLDHAATLSMEELGWRRRRRWRRWRGGETRRRVLGGGVVDGAGRRAGRIGGVGGHARDDSARNRPAVRDLLVALPVAEVVAVHPARVAAVCALALDTPAAEPIKP